MLCNVLDSSSSSYSPSSLPTPLLHLLFITQCCTASGVQRLVNARSKHLWHSLIGWSPSPYLYLSFNNSFRIECPSPYRDPMDVWRPPHVLSPPPTQPPLDAIVHSTSIMPCHSSNHLASNTIHVCHWQKHASSLPRQDTKTKIEPYSC